MPSTYSVNQNSIYEADRLASYTDALYLLPDNSSKLISPYDVRSAILTAWEASTFQQTTGSASIEYIGIDDPNVKEKIYFGKKQINGTDVLNSTLLDYNQNDTDIFFFNNKSGTYSNTKLSFLAGTNSYLYTIAPYLNVYSTTSSTLDLSLVNQSGDIIFDSLSGVVSINNVVFPTNLQTSSASNGQILKYYNGQLVWSDATIDLVSIGNTSSTTTIEGSPVLINGYNIELNSSYPIINQFGNIKPGMTFSNAPIVEVVRQMLYPYLPPTASVSVNIGNGFKYNVSAEVNSPILATVSWSITKMSDPLATASLTNVTGFTPPSFPISTPGLTSISSYAIGATYAGGSTGSILYTLTTNDTGVSNYYLTNMALPTLYGFSASIHQQSFSTSDIIIPPSYGDLSSQFNPGDTLYLSDTNNSNPPVTLPRFYVTFGSQSVTIASNGVTYSNITGTTLKLTGLSPLSLNPNSIPYKNIFVTNITNPNFLGDYQVPSYGVPTTILATASLDLIYPFFYGISSDNVNSGVINLTNWVVTSSNPCGPTFSQWVLPNLTKSIQHLVEGGTSSKYVNLQGNGYIYFCYPAYYGLLSQILDPNGFDMTTSFTRLLDKTSNHISYSNITINSEQFVQLTSPNNYWSGVEYEIYKFGPVSVQSSINSWQFRF